MSKLEDANKICKSLSSMEKEYVDGLFPANLVYLKVSYINKKPVGFIAIKKDSTNKDRYCIIAVISEYRKQGIANNLVKQAIFWFTKSEFDSLFWSCNVENTASKNLAKKNNFKFVWKKDNNKANVYVIKKEQ